MEAKSILENWLEKNKNHPFVCNIELKELSIKTNLDRKYIKRWLDNQRSKLRKKGDIPAKCFSTKDKIVLQNFFYKNTKHPGPNDIAILADIIKKDQNKIKTWFTQERFKNKERLSI